jgi:hypothetical protein
MFEMLCCECREHERLKGCGRCSKCHVLYMREWRRNNRKKRDRLAYNSGVEALRSALSDVFKSIGRAELSGYTALQIVSNCAAKVPRETLA